MLAREARKLIGHRVRATPNSGAAIIGRLTAIDGDTPNPGTTRTGRSWCRIAVEEVASWPTTAFGRASKREPFPPREGATATVGIINVKPHHAPRVPYAESILLAFTARRVHLERSAASAYYATRAPQLAREAMEDLAALLALDVPAWLGAPLPAPTPGTVLRRAVPILLNGWSLDPRPEGYVNWTTLRDAVPQAANELGAPHLATEALALLQRAHNVVLPPAAARDDLAALNNALAPTRLVLPILTTAAQEVPP